MLFHILTYFIILWSVSNAQRKEVRIQGRLDTTIRALPRGWKPGPCDIDDNVCMTKRMLKMLNDYRKKKKLPALAHGSINQMKNALQHSKAMRARGKLYHQNIKAVKLGCNAWFSGENVAKNHGLLSKKPTDPARMCLDQFIESAPHRKNLKNKYFEAVVMGVVVGDDGYFWCTQTFTQRTKFGDKDCAPVGEKEESKSNSNGKGSDKGKEKGKDRGDLAAIVVDDAFFPTSEAPFEAASETDSPSIEDAFGRPVGELFQPDLVEKTPLPPSAALDPKVDEQPPWDLAAMISEQPPTANGHTFKMQSFIVDFGEGRKAEFKLRCKTGKCKYCLKYEGNEVTCLKVSHGIKIDKALSD